MPGTVPLTDDGRNYLSPGEFARRIGWSLSTVRRYIRQGRLPAVQLVKRGRLRIPVDCLNNLPSEPPVTEPPAAPEPNRSTITPQPAPEGDQLPTPRPRPGPKPRWM